MGTGFERRGNGVKYAGCIYCIVYGMLLRTFDVSFFFLVQDKSMCRKDQLFGPLIPLFMTLYVNMKNR